MSAEEKFNINLNVKTVVLIAPLDWGLGHATRCIPIIRYLIAINCEVVIAGEGLQLSLLKEEFPFLAFLPLAGYRLKFSDKRWKTLLKIIVQIPKILIGIRREHVWLENLLFHRKIDAVIADNRYGFHHNKAASIFITHQLTIKTPFGRWLEGRLRRVNYRYIQRFSECWIPDFEGPVNMGGELSHPSMMPPLPVKFIGRLSHLKEKAAPIIELGLLIILSGPEPQRGIFEKILLNQFSTYTKPAVLLRGLPGNRESLDSPYKNLSIYNHVGSEKLASLVHNARFIVSRSGYSTVMDVIGSGRKCIFVPTPGQTEQEYLADYLSSRNFCVSFQQSNFSLDKALQLAGDRQFKLFEDAGAGRYQAIVKNFITNLPHQKV